MNLEEQQLAQSVSQLALMADALSSLSREVLPKNPRMFAVMAEGPLEEIRRLHLEVCQQAAALGSNQIANPAAVEP